MRATTARTTSPPPPYRVFRDRLGNGMRIVTVEAPHLHTATVALYVRVGARYETPATSGLSHFVEHMLFRGSARHPSSYELNLAIEDLGGTLYAETGRDYSLYQVSLAPRGLARAVAILGDLFAAPRFADINLEREMILEELLEDVDDRGRNVNIDDLSRALMFPGQPLGFPIIGPARNVRGFSTDDVRAHFERFYRAHNMVLCLGGRVAHTETAAWARASFGDLPAGIASVPKPPRVRARGPYVRCVETDASQTSVSLVFHGLPDNDPDYAAQMVLVRLLDDGMTTPLHYRVCDQKGLAYSVAAEIEPLHDTSLFEVDAACAPGKLMELLTEVTTILRELVAGPPTAAALDRAKRRYRDQLDASFDDVDSLCGWFGGTELFFRPKTHAERARLVQRVTAARVARAARRILRPGRLGVVVTGAVDPGLAARVRRFVRGLRL